MKFIIGFFMISSSLFGQVLSSSEGFWLPQKLVDSVLTNGAKQKYFDYQIPIDHLYFHDGVLGVTCYQADGNTVQLTPDVDRPYKPGRYKFRPAMPLSDALASYQKSTFYITRENNRLLVEIESDGKCDSIYFINNYSGIEFGKNYVEYEQTEYKLSCSGTYQLCDAKDSILISNVLITFDGAIKNWGIFERFEIEASFQNTLDASILMDSTELHRRNIYNYVRGYSIIRLFDWKNRMLGGFAELEDKGVHYLFDFRYEIDPNIITTSKLIYKLKPIYK